MKCKTMLRGTIVAIVLFFAGTVVAGNSGVSCSGDATDQNGQPIEGVEVISSFNGVSTTTDGYGHYRMDNLSFGSTVSCEVPEGYTPTSSTTSQTLTKSENVKNFTFRENSSSK